MNAWLSRVTLRKEASVSTLTSTLLQHGGGIHSLIWSLFAGDNDQKRDFLYRQVNQKCFYLFSGRCPKDQHGLFDILPPKPFEPVIKKGDQLGFMLRANPVKGRSEKGRKSGNDVVMHALHRVPQEQRAKERQRLVWSAGYEWLVQQGLQAGFKLALEGKEARRCLHIDGYKQHFIPRRRRKPISFSSLDFEGRLIVEDPERFLEALHSGFGRAKAFGCGLMLVRRA